MTILGPTGEAISSADFAKPKAKSKARPLIGEIAPSWTDGVDRVSPIAPPENTLQFDTSRLTLKDYRLMRDHYQVNSSLSVLAFMLHQTPYTLVDGDKEATKWCEENLEFIWTRLVRSFCQAHWAGYSPMALQWENDEENTKIKLAKIKDLTPEDCRIKWKRIKGVGGTGGRVISDAALNELERREMGSTSPYARIFDGIYQTGYADIPKENSLWYSLLTENGNMYGTKLLNAAFQPWYFSLLIHLYSNRYFERFGEPLMIGRAPYDDEIDIGGSPIPGHLLMQHFMGMARNGASPILPNTRPMNGTEMDSRYEYEIEYLESQMRGADFDRYITKLDDEISLALFTPLSMMRGGEHGYNTSVGQTQVYQWQLNSILADWVDPINKYVLAPMTRYNFGDKAKAPRIKFMKQGTLDTETMRAMIGSLLSKGGLKVNIDELAQHAGISMEEQEILVAPPNGQDPLTGKPVGPDAKKPAAKPGEKPAQKAQPGTSTKPDTRVRVRPGTPKGVSSKRNTIAAGMADRITGQFQKGNDKPDVGFHAQYIDQFEDSGMESEDLQNSYWALTDDIESAYQTATEVELNAANANELFLSVINRQMDRVEGYAL